MGILYDLSFAFFVFLTGASVLASGASLVYQALFSATNAEANWNVIAIAGSYVALVRYIPNIAPSSSEKRERPSYHLGSISVGRLQRSGI